MRRLLNLSLLLAISLPANVYGLDICNKLLAPEEDIEDLSHRIDLMRSRLFHNTGVAIIEDGKTLAAAGFEAAYRGRDRTILLMPDRDVLLQFISQHHEIVHAITDQRLRTHPDDPENALAIQIYNNNDPLLPPEYRHNYLQLDEMKAYIRTLQLVRQVARRTSSNDPEKLQAIRDFSRIILGDATNFSLAVENNLDQAKAMMIEPSQKPLNYSFVRLSKNDYAPDRHDIVDIVAQYPNGVKIRYRVYEPNADSMKLHEFWPKLLQLCDDGMKYARYYQQRAKEIAKEIDSDPGEPER